ncbi:MAG: COX15/CtaA family protein [Betaproteobacteria bacterium]|nr:COX15/CtaA family protein [Betaproteobacteria bacterium]
MSPEFAATFGLQRRLATGCALLVLVVVAASAYLRLGQAGFSCADWPACFGRIEINQQTLALEPLVFWARVAHRLAAMGVAVLVLSLVVLGYRQRREDARSLRLALLALSLTLFLAVLGRWTPGTRVPAVTLGNLLGGFMLLAALWRLRAAPSVRRQAHPARGLLLLCAVLLAGQVALGGMVSASFAGPSCPGFPGCGPQGMEVRAELFNPFRSIALDAAGVAERPAGLAGLVVAHRLLALILSVALLSLAWRLWQAPRPERGLAVRLLVLIGLAYGLGVATALTAPPLGLVFGHNFVAALLVLTLADAA